MITLSQQPAGERLQLPDSNHEHQRALHKQRTCTLSCLVNLVIASLQRELAQVGSFAGRIICMKPRTSSELWRSISPVVTHTDWSQHVLGTSRCYNTHTGPNENKTACILKLDVMLSVLHRVI